MNKWQAVSELLTHSIPIAHSRGCALSQTEPLTSQLTYSLRLIEFTQLLGNIQDCVSKVLAERVHTFLKQMRRVRKCIVVSVRACVPPLRLFSVHL